MPLVEVREERKRGGKAGFLLGPWCMCRRTMTGDNGNACDDCLVVLKSLGADHEGA